MLAVLHQKDQSPACEEYKRRTNRLRYHHTYNPSSIWSTTCVPVQSDQSRHVCAIVLGMGIFMISSGRSRTLQTKPAAECQVK